MKIYPINGIIMLSQRKGLMETLTLCMEITEWVLFVKCGDEKKRNRRHSLKGSSSKYGCAAEAFWRIKK